MHMVITIRRAAAEDASAISEIYALSWKTAYRGVVPQAYLDELKLDFWKPKFENWIQNNVLKADILFLDETPVGCVAYGKAREEQFADWGEIVSIYIHPDHFRKGYGKMLLNSALKNFKEDGFEDCYLWVLSENTNAQQFYKQNGFTPTQDQCQCEIMGKQLTDLRYTLHLG